MPIHVSRLTYFRFGDIKTLTTCDVVDLKQINPVYSRFKLNLTSKRFFMNHTQITRFNNSLTAHT